MCVREEGDWESWIEFFLKGVAFVADEATESAKSIIALQRKYEAVLNEQDSNNRNYQPFLSYLFENPIVSRKDIITKLNVTSPTAGNILSLFCSLGILEDATPDKQRYKSYAFREYLNILQKGTELPFDPFSAIADHRFADMESAG